MCWNLTGSSTVWSHVLQQPTGALFSSGSIDDSIFVKFAPSSGLAVGSPLITAAAEDCRAYVAAPPTSPCSQVLPGRRGGPPSGDLTAPSALSLRAEGMEALVPPLCTGGDAGRELPVPSNRSGRRRWTYICSVRDRIFITPVCCSSPEVSFWARLPWAGT